VLLARPCPFYILDEVEAALDDINLDRFLRSVRRFADRSQFIIVTHQKRTMDAADALYGISMGDDGITKVVSRRLPRDEVAERRADIEQGGAEPPVARAESA
jgi:chromosome segregation protein